MQHIIRQKIYFPAIPTFRNRFTYPMTKLIMDRHVANLKNTSFVCVYYLGFVALQQEFVLTIDKSPYMKTEKNFKRGSNIKCRYVFHVV